ALQQLPRYKLAPTAPSRYRIRREPTESALSTLEATVAALKSLEPETAGFDQLLAAFDQMIDRQLMHPKLAARWQQHTRRSPTLGNIPHTLLGEQNSIVVIYGESSPGGQSDCPLAPVYWVAERLGTHERFACTIQSPARFSDAYLGYLELPAAYFNHAVSLTAAQQAWQSFVRPGDLLTVYTQGTANLLRQLSNAAPHCLVLKSINLAWREPYPTLTQLLLGEKIPCGAAWADGRAGQRLAELVAFVHYLRSLSAASS
ncbi:MAG TPA: DTW domain-containing protein, partial [Pirellulaceae bacterium]|nr:DTW domain-containing protein [Pirellulaceae bacterium]